MALVTVRKLNGLEAKEVFDPQKGSGILAVLKEDYGTGKLLNAKEHRITPEQDVAAGQYTYQVTAAAQPPQAPAEYQRFLGLLSSTHYNKPREEVLTIVRQQFATSVVVCATPDDAASLYELAQALPSADTKRHFYTQHGLTVNGLLFPGGDGPKSILTALDRNGVPKAVKLLSPRMDLPGNEQHEPMEAVVVKTLCTPATAKDLAIVPAQVIVINLTKDDTASTRRPAGQYAALVMNRYVSSVARSIQPPVATIAVQGQRMLKAVEHIHQKRFVHMDIKLDNFFMDFGGQWHLGDFGSCVRVDQAITSTTQVMNPMVHLINTPALPWYDHHMLAVALMTAVFGQDKWKEELVENGCVPPHKLRAAVSAMSNTEEHSQLKQLLEMLLKKCEMAAGYPPAP